MKTALRNPSPIRESNLNGVIEPLAGYICAADQPADALETILSALISQVEETNRAAETGIGKFQERRTSLTL